VTSILSRRIVEEHHADDQILIRLGQPHLALSNASSENIGSSQCQGGRVTESQEQYAGATSSQS